MNKDAYMKIEINNRDAKLEMNGSVVDISAMTAMLLDYIADRLDSKVKGNGQMFKNVISLFLKDGDDGQLDNELKMMDNLIGTLERLTGNKVHKVDLSKEFDHSIFKDMVKQSMEKPSKPLPFDPTTATAEDWVKYSRQLKEEKNVK